MFRTAFLTITLMTLVLSSCSAPLPTSKYEKLSSADKKPRVVITTDPELDDSNSLIRYLLYSTDFQTEGLIYASSQFHWKGDGKGTRHSVPGREYTRYGLNICPCESWRWSQDERFIDDALSIYEQAYENLRIHNPNYPKPSELKSKVRWGNVEFDGDISKDTPGSDLIRELLLDDNPSPIYLLAWGGGSTIARALKSIQEQYGRSESWSEIYTKVARKAVLSMSGDQDDSYAKYIQPNWPDIQFLTTGQNGVSVRYGAFLFASEENATYLSAEWTKKNISSVGSFGMHYRVWGDGKQMVPGDIFDYFGESGYTAEQLKEKGYIVWLPPRPKGEFLGEGDTFTFLNLVDNGLNAHQTMTPGGWGGWIDIKPELGNSNSNSGQEDALQRLAKADSVRSRPLSPEPNFTPAAQNDFAARMLWSVTPLFSNANHEPTVEVAALDQSAMPGDNISLTGVVTDPDNNNVTVRWWRWRDVDTYPGIINIQNSNTVAASFSVPTDAMKGQTIQIILEVTDDGTPALTRYQRVLVTII